MNVLDVAILVFLSFFLYRGFKKGLIREIFGLVAVLVALVVAVVCMNNGVALLVGLSDAPTPVALAISFLIIFAVVYAVVRIVGAILHKIIRLTLLGWLDRLGGLLFGLLKSLLIASLILLGLTLLSWPSGIDKVIDRSTLAPSVQMVAPRFFNYMKFLSPAAKSIYKEFRESVSAYADLDPNELKNKAVKKVLHIFEKAE